LLTKDVDQPDLFTRHIHLINVFEKLLFLSVFQENTHQDIEEIVRMFERGKAVHKNGTTMDVLSDQADAIRRYVEDGSVYVDVSYSRHKSGGTYVFELVGDTLVLKRKTMWKA